jgi:hypothetical protein
MKQPRYKKCVRNIPGFVEKSDFMHLISIKQEINQAKKLDNIRTVNNNISKSNSRIINNAS